MGKISNTIQMLNYLNTGNKYTVKELSEKMVLLNVWLGIIKLN